MRFLIFLIAFAAFSCTKEIKIDVNGDVNTVHVPTDTPERVQILLSTPDPTIRERSLACEYTGVCCSCGFDFTFQMNCGCGLRHSCPGSYEEKFTKTTVTYRIVYTIDGHEVQSPVMVRDDINVVSSGSCK